MDIQYLKNFLQPLPKSYGNRKNKLIYEKKCTDHKPLIHTRVLFCALSQVPLSIYALSRIHSYVDKMMII